MGGGHDAQAEGPFAPVIMECLPGLVYVSLAAGVATACLLVNWGGVTTCATLFVKTDLSDMKLRRQWRTPVEGRWRFELV